MKTLFTGLTRIDLAVVDSTNNYAHELLKKGKVQEGTLIYTANQLTGRGQRSNVWQSNANENLTISIIYKPVFLSVSEQFVLNKAVALAVADSFRKIIGESVENSNVKIKWSNDIYWKDRKVAGILIENMVRGDKLQTSIIGIGMNLNQTEFAPDVPNPSSAILITGKTYNTEECLNLLCESLEAHYLKLVAGRKDHISDQYDHLLYRKGIESEFRAEDYNFFGSIQAVNKSGKLVVETESGSRKDYGYGEISMIRG